MASAQTVLSCTNGHCLVWDFTCSDTLATSHLNRAVLESGFVANDAESRKSIKYSSLSTLYCFIPTAIKTLGVPGDEALSFLGQRIAVATAEPRSFKFLMQRPSVAIQRGNATCIALELCPLLLAGTDFFKFSIDTFLKKILVVEFDCWIYIKLYSIFFKPSDVLL